MSDTVPAAEEDLSHPSWCAQYRCTIAAPHGGGSHESHHRKFELTSGGTLTLFMEQAATEEPMLTVEERGCACSECEPTTFFSLSVPSAQRLLAMAGSWIGGAEQ